MQSRVATPVQHGRIGPSGQQVVCQPRVLALDGQAKEGLTVTVDGRVQVSVRVVQKRVIDPLDHRLVVVFLWVAIIAIP